MRKVTATEKLRAVNEGSMSKKEFIRQMRQEFPTHITQFNGFDDSVQILKNRGIIYEAKQVVVEKHVYDDKPVLNYSLDALDRGIRAELASAGITMPSQGINPEEYIKAENKAKSNLEKNPTHYLDLMSGESNKVDKHDKMKETKRGAADTDAYNALKKATLKEGYTEEQINDAIQRLKEKKSMEGQEESVTDVSIKEVGTTALKGVMSAAVSVIKSKYGNLPGLSDIIKDFLKTHLEDLAAGADPLEEFEQFVDANYDRLNEKQGKDHDGDGDIDGDDYMAAKDKAIKKAMGKDPKEEQLKEAIKSIIKKTLLNEAATVKLSDWAESYETFPGVKPVVNELENIVTEIETFYDKMGGKIANVFEKAGDFENEEGLKIGGFIAPSLESAFRQDLSKVIKKGSFFSKINLPKVRTITQADVDANNSGERPLGETDIAVEPKSTVFTPNF